MLQSKERDANAERRNDHRTRYHLGRGRTRSLLGAATVILCMTVYALHITALPLPGWNFGDAHLHNLMAMPILLGWIDCIASRETAAGGLVTGVGFSAALTAVCCMIWELLVPVLKPSSVGDWLDVLAYVAGSLFYLATRAILMAYFHRFNFMQGTPK